MPARLFSLPPNTLLTSINLRDHLAPPAPVIVEQPLVDLSALIAQVHSPAGRALLSPLAIDAQLLVRQGRFQVDTAREREVDLGDLINHAVIQQRQLQVQPGDDDPLPNQADAGFGVPSPAQAGAVLHGPLGVQLAQPLELQPIVESGPVVVIGLFA